MKKAKAILNITVFIGIIIILGTAGASDLGRLSLLESISQILLGIIFIFCGRSGLNLLKLARPAKRKKLKLQKHTAYQAKASNAA